MRVRAYLGVKNAQFCQSLHHFLVINVAGVVTIISPAKHEARLSVPFTSQYDRVGAFQDTKVGMCEGSVSTRVSDLYVCTSKELWFTSTGRSFYLKISAALAPPPPPPKSMFSQSVFFMVLPPAVCIHSVTLLLVKEHRCLCQMSVPVRVGVKGTKVLNCRETRCQQSRVQKGLRLGGQSLAWKFRGLCIHQQEARASSWLPCYPCCRGLQSPGTRYAPSTPGRLLQRPLQTQLRTHFTLDFAHTVRSASRNSLSSRKGLQRGLLFTQR